MLFLINWIRQTLKWWCVILFLRFVHLLFVLFVVKLSNNLLTPKMRWSQWFPLQCGLCISLHKCNWGWRMNSHWFKELILFARLFKSFSLGACVCVCVIQSFFSKLIRAVLLTKRRMGFISTHSFHSFTSLWVFEGGRQGVKYTTVRQRTES